MCHGSVALRADVAVIVTANVHPDEWFPKAPRAHRAALLSRLHIVEVTEPLYERPAAAAPAAAPSPHAD